MTTNHEATEKVEGHVWCDNHGDVHRDEPNPYDEGHWKHRKGIKTWVEAVCPGPHRPLYVGVE